MMPLAVRRLAIDRARLKFRPGLEGVHGISLLVRSLVLSRDSVIKITPIVVDFVDIDVDVLPLQDAEVENNAVFPTINHQHSMSTSTSTTYIFSHVHFQLYMLLQRYLNNFLRLCHLRRVLVVRHVGPRPRIQEATETE